MATMMDELDNSGRAGRNDMKRFYIALAVVALEGGAWFTPTRAAPPTVTPSPGYDARLQEQRAATTVYESSTPAPKPVVRRRVKRHDGAH
jgi:hypothetical protein